MSSTLPRITHLPFADRQDAARQLAQALDRYRGSAPVVLAIPRGAVPMARIIADALEGEMDLALVHKLGAPDYPELAVGAIDERGTTYVSEYAQDVGADAAYLNEEAARQLALIQERRRTYSRGKPPRDLRERTVIVIDDGLATGATMMAALRATRALGPKRLVCAVPVASTESLQRVGALADEVVCLASPEPFHAVGHFYRRFPQVEDEEVIALLRDDAPASKRMS